MPQRQAERQQTGKQQTGKQQTGNTPHNGFEALYGVSAYGGQESAG